MFDIGFWELALIGVVALLVVGPERLPALARTVGFWLGKARRLVGSVREDIERELQAEEFRRLRRSSGLEDVRSTLEDTKRELSTDVSATPPPSETPAESQAPAESAPSVTDTQPTAGTQDKRHEQP